jgi:hypothetical protein
MMAVFYQTIDMKIPKWQQDKSVIGNNPGKILNAVAWHWVVLL